MNCDSARKLKLLVRLQLYLVLKRFKKHFATLHNRDSKLFCFPNTSISCLSVPYGLQICKNLKDFGVKTLKGGFQRRPELILEQSGESKCCQTAEEKVLLRNWNRITKKNHRIQEELVQKAMNLIHQIKIMPENHVDTMKETVPMTRKDLIILDIGCGDGTSTAPLLNMGFSCVGIDLNHKSLSQFKQYIKSNEQMFSMRHNRCEMKNVQSQNTQNDTWQRQFMSPNSFHLADFIRWDLRYGLPFTPNSFDMAVSISFLQWLFYGEKERQLKLFFSSLKSALRVRRSAVIQFYPRTPDQLEDAVRHASSYFQGVVVADYPHIDRGRKLFLVLFT